MRAEPGTDHGAGALQRRHVLKWAGGAAVMAQVAMAPLGASGVAVAAAPTASAARPGRKRASQSIGSLRDRTIGYMLAHEQFPVPQLAEIGAEAARAGFGLLATSDHFQPWQANEGHSGEAWVTMAALGAPAPNAWMGTTVTCPILRYNPAVVAEGFASLSHLYPGR